jgi:two-component system, OmpR family, alkaline phosphatase synthesis response regulator PhoP
MSDMVAWRCTQRGRQGDSMQKVLVVDDNADLRAIIRRLLEKNGFTVTEAASGKRALDLLKEDIPDVILLDVMMPEMSGFEVLDHIRRNPTTAKLPVVMVTAKNEDQDVLTGYQTGADYYLTKPYTPEHLIYSIGLVLGRPDLVETSRRG